MFANLASNIFGQIVSNAWNIAATYTLYRIYENTRNSQLTWRNTLKGIGVAIVNFGFFYCSPTIARKFAESAFPFVYGNQPSWWDIAWSPLNSVEYYHNETRVIEYAIEYGPLVILPLGQKVSSEIVDLLEGAGIKMLEAGTELGKYMLDNHPTLIFSPLDTLSDIADSVGYYLGVQKSHRYNHKKTGK